jgi:hypothetical protein
MSIYAKIKAVEREIDMINHQIDMKIIIGRPYRRDAVKHRMLVAQMKDLKRSRDNAWFSRMAHSFSMFMF